MQSSKESSGVDKQGLYGWWHNGVQWQNELHRRGAYKALDMPEGDPMIVSNRGMGWKELAVIAALLTAGGWMVKDHLSGTQTAPPAAVSPADSEYEVRFFDADGNPIKVPHISERPEP